MKKRRIIAFQIVLILIVSIASVTIATDESIATASADIEYSKTVILDAGHAELPNTTD